MKIRVVSGVSFMNGLIELYVSCYEFWNDTCVGTPTWHHIPFPHSVSRFSSQLPFLCLHTHPRTIPDNGRI